MKRSRLIVTSATLALGWVSSASADALAVAVPPAPPGAADFMVMRNWIWAGAQLLSLAIPAIFLFTGWSARLSTSSMRLAGGKRYRGLLLFAVAYLTLSGLLAFPYDYYREQASLGAMADNLSQWVVGEALSLGEKIAAAILLAWIPYRLMVKTSRRWWFYTATAFIPIAALALVIVPAWLKPLTGHFHPLEDVALSSEIRTLAARCGVHDVPVVVGGNDTTVVGLGPASRIILGDNLLKHQTDAQIRFTVGHELKHYILRDEFKGLLIVIATLFVGFFLCDRVGLLLTRRYQSLLGFEELSNPASLPLFILIFTTLWLCVLPVFNWYARHIEFEADRFGLELTHENRAMAEAEAAYITQGGDSPEWDTFFLIFRATHPSDAERIRFANSYRPWVEGKPMAYSYICR